MLVGATLCLTGCFSIDTSVSEVSGESHVVISNFGWQFLGDIPLFCGNATDENRIGEVAFFRDDVTLAKLQKRMLKLATDQGKAVNELTFHNNSSVLIEIPLTNITIPLPYIICYREIQISGVMK